MKFLFKRKRQIAPQAGNSESVKDMLNKSIHKAQKRSADWMQVKSEQLPVKAKWVLFFLFCLITISGSIFLIIGALSKKEKASFKVARIKTPVQLERPKTESSMISHAEFERIMDFKIYMDSLARSPNTRAEYERIKRQHPGLMDSIKTVEIFYKSQF